VRSASHDEKGVEEAVLRHCRFKIEKKVRPALVKSATLVRMERPSSVCTELSATDTAVAVRFNSGYRPILGGFSLINEQRLSYFLG